MKLKVLARRSLWIPVVMLVSPLCGGCGGTVNPDGREDVSGMIEINGEPLTCTAGIVFDPIEGERSAGGQGQIMKGEYFLTGHDGVKPGKYIVRITGVIDFDKTTGKVADASVVFGNEVPVDVVPPEFNTGSQIEFEVVGGRKNVFNYNIETDYKPTMPEKVELKAPVPL